MSAYMGAVVEHVVALDAQTQVIARSPSTGTARFPAGTRVGLTWSESAECAFDTKDRPMRRIPSNEKVETDA